VRAGLVFGPRPFWAGRAAGRPRPAACHSEGGGAKRPLAISSSHMASPHLARSTDWSPSRATHRHLLQSLQVRWRRISLGRQGREFLQRAGSRPLSFCGPSLALSLFFSLSLSLSLLHLFLFLANLNCQNSSLSCLSSRFSTHFHAYSNPNGSYYGSRHLSATTPTPGGHKGPGIPPPPTGWWDSACS
jgi:hypothetical protein